MTDVAPDDTPALVAKFLEELPASTAELTVCRLEFQRFLVEHGRQDDDTSPDYRRTDSPADFPNGTWCAWTSEGGARYLLHRASGEEMPWPCDPLMWLW